MLQSTSGYLYSCFTQPHIPRVLDRMGTPARLEATLVHIKERKKRFRYYGSTLANYNDRIFMYGSMGGPKGTRYIVEKHHHRVQYCHPGDPNNRYNIRTVRMANAQFDQLGGFTRMRWDNAIGNTNVLQDQSLDRNATCLLKQEAINRVEEWGVPYILLDEMRKPSVMDCKYHRHQLYPLKFRWSPDPATNGRTGDADWKWRGDELIPYTDCNASLKDDKNKFRSLWMATSNVEQEKVEGGVAFSASRNHASAES
ncbi:unnamed protein product [Phytomonas sp. EM1]|nr:unnamed protein product [Phytomonas sp. EM1]|eukprot:CCW62263.1 unnamed protein product [Phytomonas sp. isolate EM1]